MFLLQTASQPRMRPSTHMLNVFAQPNFRRLHVKRQTEVVGACRDLRVARFVLEPSATKEIYRVSSLVDPWAFRHDVTQAVDEVNSGHRVPIFILARSRFDNRPYTVDELIFNI